MSEHGIKHLLDVDPDFVAFLSDVFRTRLGMLSAEHPGVTTIALPAAFMKLVKEFLDAHAGILTKELREPENLIQAAVPVFCALLGTRLMKSAPKSDPLAGIRERLAKRIQEAVDSEKATADPDEVDAMLRKAVEQEEGVGEVLVCRIVDGVVNCAACPRDPQKCQLKAMALQVAGPGPVTIVRMPREKLDATAGKAPEPEAPAGREGAN